MELIELKLSRNIVALASGAAVTIGIILGVVPLSASAATSSCTNTGNGTLCVNIDSRGYRAQYYKSSGNPVTADFTLYCNNGTWHGDDGAFTATRGNTYSYVFRVAYQGSCYLKLYDRGNGGEWATGSIQR